MIYMNKIFEDSKNYFKDNNFYLTIAISVAIATFLIVFFKYEPFFLWVFSRHQNVLSWAIRPLLLLPFCYFAHKKNLNGILLTILAIFTSMFWFPEPAQINPQVAEFLNMEKEYLTSGFNIIKASFIGAIIIFFSLLATAFWKRSVKIGIGVAACGAILKIIWSVIESPDGGSSIIPFAISGLAVLIISIVIYKKIKNSNLKRK